jgi:hypothetical protein
MSYVDASLAAKQREREEMVTEEFETAVLAYLLNTGGSVWLKQQKEGWGGKGREGDAAGREEKAKGGEAAGRDAKAPEGGETTGGEVKAPEGGGEPVGEAKAEGEVKTGGNKK